MGLNKRALDTVWTRVGLPRLGLRGAAGICWAEAGELLGTPQRPGRPTAGHGSHGQWGPVGRHVAPVTRSNPEDSPKVWLSELPQTQESATPDSVRKALPQTPGWAANRPETGPGCGGASGPWEPGLLVAIRDGGSTSSHSAQSALSLPQGWGRWLSQGRAPSTPGPG